MIMRLNVEERIHDSPEGRERYQVRFELVNFPPPGAADTEETVRSFSETFLIEVNEAQWKRMLPGKYIEFEDIMESESDGT